MDQVAGEPRNVSEAGRDEIGELLALSDALPPCLLEPVVFSTSGDAATREAAAAPKLLDDTAKRDRRRLVERNKRIRRQVRCL